MSSLNGDYVVRRAGAERQPHVLIVAYLFPPCEMVAVRRPAALRNAFESAGVRTTVLSSAISGAYTDDAARGILRAGDLRTRFSSPYQALVGYRSAIVDIRTKPRWWTRLLVPDVPTLSWAPAALRHLRRLLRDDPPDAVLTTSPPEATHFLGAVARSRGAAWIADFRDGWMFDPPNRRSVLQWVDGSLERVVIRSADHIMAINRPIADDFAHRFGVRVSHVSNGFDRSALAAATDERAMLDARRFSIVYTGTVGLDAPARDDHDRGAGARAFFGALRRALQDRRDLAQEVEIVIAGILTQAERDVLQRDPLRKVVRLLGHVPHERALGFQRAANGLLLFGGTGTATTTGKVLEYLSAEKPVFAVGAPEGAAGLLLQEAGPHTIVSPDDERHIASSLLKYLEQWTNSQFRPDPHFDFSAYDFGRLGRDVLDLFVSAGAFERVSGDQLPARVVAG